MQGMTGVRLAFRRPEIRRRSLVFCRGSYHLATPALAALARSEAIYKAEKFSDHAPITLDYDFKLWVLFTLCFNFAIKTGAVRAVP